MVLQDEVVQKVYKVGHGLQLQSLWMIPTAAIPMDDPCCSCKLTRVHYKVVRRCVCRAGFEMSSATTRPLEPDELVFAFEVRTAVGQTVILLHPPPPSTFSRRINRDGEGGCSRVTVSSMANFRSGRSRAGCTGSAGPTAGPR